MSISLFLRGAVAQRLVQDPERAKADLEDYILQAYKADQQQAGAGLAGQKASASALSQAQLGPATGAFLPVVASSDYIAPKPALRKAVDPSPELQNYMRWVKLRRVAQAALLVQLKALSARQDGQPMDWATHTAVATRLSAMGNEALAASTLEANAAAEGRVRLKMKISDHFRAEVETKRRDRLEQDLAESAAP